MKLFSELIFKLGVFNLKEELMLPKANIMINKNYNDRK